MKSQPKTSFTLHAGFHINEPTREERKIRLSEEAIAKILDEGKAVPIGRDGRKVHLAFYSEPADACFIAIQDTKNGEVLTIMPITYHHRWALDKMCVLKMARSCFIKTLTFHQLMNPLSLRE